MKLKEEIKYPTLPDKFQVICQVGTIDGEFCDTSFPLIYKNGELQNGSFTFEPWGFSHSYIGEDKEELEAILDELAIVLSDKYGIPLSEKPIENENYEFI